MEVLVPKDDSVVLKQLEQMRDALADMADEWGLWSVVYAIDEVLTRYDALKHPRRRIIDC